MLKLLAAATLCAATMGAWADTTFEFAVSGSGQFGYTPPMGGTPTIYTGPFTGTAFLTLAGAADGTYSMYASDPSLELTQFEFQGSIDGFPVGVDSTSSHGTGLSAQVQGGEVKSISGSLDASFGGCSTYGARCLTFNGLSFTYTQLSGPVGGAGGILTGALTPIPEPSTWGLMAVGLLALAHRRTPRRALTAARMVS